jgi:hypothetical protein
MAGSTGIECRRYEVGGPPVVTIWLRTPKMAPGLVDGAGVGVGVAAHNGGVAGSGAR